MEWLFVLFYFLYIFNTFFLPLCIFTVNELYSSKQISIEPFYGLIFDEHYNNRVKTIFFTEISK